MFTLIARLILCMALLGIWLSASAEPGYALSCPSWSGSPSDALATSHSVFRGVVTSISVVEKEDGSWSNADLLVAEFLVSEVWKGPTSRTRTLKTARSGASCGFEFEFGAEYLVYTDDGGSFISLCSRTHNLAPGFYDVDYNDLEELGPGQAPTADATDPAPTAVVEIPATGGGCGSASSSGADVWWAALAVGAAWLGGRGLRPKR